MEEKPEREYTLNKGDILIIRLVFYMGMPDLIAEVVRTEEEGRLKVSATEGGRFSRLKSGEDFIIKEEATILAQKDMRDDTNTLLEDYHARKKHLACGLKRIIGKDTQDPLYCYPPDVTPPPNDKYED